MQIKSVIWLLIEAETNHLVQDIIRYHSLVILGNELEEIAEELLEEDLICIDAENKFIACKWKHHT